MSQDQKRFYYQGQGHTLHTFICDWMQRVSANLFSNASLFHKTGTDTPPPQGARSLNAPLCGSIQKSQSKCFSAV